MRYVIFGAGNYGQETLKILGAENICYFIDNSSEKINNEVYGKTVLSFKEGISKKENAKIVIAVSEMYRNQMETQLKNAGVDDYCTYAEIKREIIKKKILSRPNYLKVYNNAIRWIDNNSIAGEGIINNSSLKLSYPEVTGYYIPTLLRWGYKERAISYAKWLCSIQKEDGSWYDTLDEAPYIFDSAQILKGLLSVRTIYEDKDTIDRAIISGCNWILECMAEDGQLITPTETAWGGVATELIHTYCLSPLVEAARVFNKNEYEVAAYKILNYYKTNYYQQIVNFSMLSHFYAYVVEAMLDMGENELAKQAMLNMEVYQKENGAVPAYNNVDWVCSTGLFQLALIWYRLGDEQRGNRAFTYACKLQNETGGWYGSYVSEENACENNNYFPGAEISWAVKYFLDALYYKNLCQFEAQAYMFRDDLDVNDQKYQIIKDEVEKKQQGKVLDVGCGKGRYLKRLISDAPAHEYFAVDISKKVMQYLSAYGEVEKKQGSLTDIPYSDNKFDIVYTCEALEHAIDIQSAIREMFRVTKKNGKVIIVDKNKNMYGYYEIEEWEQWFDKDELLNIMSHYCETIEYVDSIAYDGKEADGLFGAWIGTKK